MATTSLPFGGGLLASYALLSTIPSPCNHWSFDTPKNSKSFSLSITDASIFTPSGSVPDTQTHRVDLLPSIRSTLNNVSTTGIKTLHFSLATDATKPLNTSHDYQVTFLETADFKTHVFGVRMGAAAGNGSAGTSVVIDGNSKAVGGAKTLFSAPVAKEGQLMNFGLRMDFDANTIQVFHSTDNNALVQVTDAVANDMTGNGEYHFGMVKNAVAGAQPTGINEAIIFGGIFIEDSAGGVVSLQ